MNLEDIRKYCLNKKGTKEDFPFDEETLVFKVGSKMYGLTNIKSNVLSLNLKCDPVMSLDLRKEYSSIRPGYHMNKRHWNTVVVDGSLPEEQIYFLIDMSYDLVYKGLKKSEKFQIESL